MSWCSLPELCGWYEKRLSAIKPSENRLTRSHRGFKVSELFDFSIWILREQIGLPHVEHIDKPLLAETAEARQLSNLHFLLYGLAAKAAAERVVAKRRCLKCIFAKSDKVGTV